MGNPTVFFEGQKLEKINKNANLGLGRSFASPHHPIAHVVLHQAANILAHQMWSNVASTATNVNANRVRLEQVEHFVRYPVAKLENCLNLNKSNKLNLVSQKPAKFKIALCRTPIALFPFGFSVKNLKKYTNE